MRSLYSPKYPLLYFPRGVGREEGGREGSGRIAQGREGGKEGREGGRKRRRERSIYSSRYHLLHGPRALHSPRYPPSSYLGVPDELAVDPTVKRGGHPFERQKDPTLIPVGWDRQGRLVASYVVAS
eukprot:739148-Rhodomonas_salina.4